MKGKIYHALKICPHASEGCPELASPNTNKGSLDAKSILVTHQDAQDAKGHQDQVRRSLLKCPFKDNQQIAAECGNMDNSDGKNTGMAKPAQLGPPTCTAPTERPTACHSYNDSTRATALMCVLTILARNEMSAYSLS